MRRILFVLDSLQIGGAERNTAQLIREFRGRGLDPQLCLMRGAPDPAMIAAAGVSEEEIHVLGVSRLYDPRGALRFVSLLRRLRPDCVHVQDPYANLIALAGRRLVGAAMVMTRHVDAPLGSSARAKLRARALYAAARRAFHRAILVAEAIRPGFRAEYAFPNQNIDVVHNGTVFGQDVVVDRAAAREKLGWDPARPVILMVAVMRPGKGHDVLLNAMREVLAAHPDCLLALVGDGPIRPEIEALAAPLGGSVAMLGQRSDIAELMIASDLVALPSLSEALPTVLLEAAMVGRPAIASDVGGVGEILEEGRTGLMTPAGDARALGAALLRLLGDQDARERMGAAAQAKAERQFTIGRQADELLGVYQKAMIDAR